MYESKTMPVYASVVLALVNLIWHLRRTQLSHGVRCLLDRAAVAAEGSKQAPSGNIPCHSMHPTRLASPNAW